jgi:hypothetical protein
MPLLGFKPAIPTIKHVQTYALDRSATTIVVLWIRVVVSPQQKVAFCATDV